MGEEHRSVKDRVDEIADRVVAGLTPFQRATVDYVMKLYRDKGLNRVLVADEVGLGKTLVARGTTAEIVRLRRDEEDNLVKVAYVCSNSAIASQNIERLRIDSEIRLANSDDSRLSMQHYTLARETLDEELAQRYVQIIPLTPQTSFVLSSSTGTLRERALMFATLRHDPAFRGNQTRTRRLKTLLWCRQAKYSPESWKSKCDWYTGRVDRLAKMGIHLSEDSPLCYPFDVIAKMKAELDEDKGLDRALLRHEPLSFGEIVARIDAGDDSRSFSVNTIISLRRAFSKASIDLMDPDFVIMDEFQRFRDLIASDDTEASMLAKRFFSSKVRVLLLSATPFRMYSTSAELEDGSFGNSYAEFFEVVKFLSGDDQQRFDDFKRVWEDYSHELASTLTTGKGALVACREKKDEAQSSAASFIARTERISTNELGALADNATHSGSIAIAPGDVKAFHAARALVRDAGVREHLMDADYLKSCPFPLSFMRDYTVKKGLDRAASRHWDGIAAVARKGERQLWVNRNDIRTYKRLDIDNSRYLQLEADIFSDGAVNHLLWVPPSLPYYEPPASSAFANVEHFSKTLIFSSWAMVPPALSTLLSYEVERRNVKRLEADYQYFKNEDERNDARSERRASESGEEDPRALPYRRVIFTDRKQTAFNLVYPSPYLASLFEDACSFRGRQLREVRAAIKKRISDDLAAAFGIDRLPQGMLRSRDASWYVMAGMALDRMYLGKGFKAFSRALIGGDTWWAPCRKKAFGVANKTMGQLLEEFDGWRYEDHADTMPANIVSVLVDAAIGSPAVCALRAYGKLFDGEVPPSLAFEFGYAFVQRMNTATATVAVAAAMGEGLSKDKGSSHWRRLLAYCCEGNLQSVIDEYTHMCAEGRRCERAGDLVRLHKKVAGVVDAEDVPTMHNAESNHVVETFEYFKANVAGQGKRRSGTMRLRTNFANAFMETRHENSGTVSRDKKRDAFNSPFWPFVLISTSIGQEGLDFHQYCRRVVHWNLPTNPIDLEQREGRVNRFKGLAVRQNVADRYGSELAGAGDVWDELFKIAEREETKRSGSEHPSGLLPFWGVVESDDMVKVERYVYSYPFSKDELRYEYLLNAVRNYRAVLGQPDQDELLATLEHRFGSVVGLDDLSELFMNLCPFAQRWRTET